MKHVTIDLNALEPEAIRSFLIVRRATGVVYRSQSGGTCCLQKAAEGFLVPLPFDVSESRLAEPLLDRHDFRETDVDAAVRLCRDLDLPFRPSYAETDRRDSCEAWINGRVHCEGRLHSLLSPECHGMPAVLVYANSD